MKWYEDKLIKAKKVSELHSQRMLYAFRKIEGFIPLDEFRYEELTDDELGYFDLLIFRFSKLQDSMGEKLFPSLLENLGEDIDNIPFLDILGKLERLRLIEDHKQWIFLREIRNIVIHEYPFNREEIIKGLNLLAGHVMILQNIFDSLILYIKNRFHF